MFRPIVNQANYNNDISFQINDWKSYDIRVPVNTDENSEESDDNNNQCKKYVKMKKIFNIQAYGITEHGNSICVRINEFKPYFFIRKPEEWTPVHLLRFKAKMEDEFEFAKDGIAYTKRIPYYYFTNYEKKTYIRLVFTNMNNFYNCLRHIKETKISICNEKYDLSKLLCETRVTSLLRFFHIKNVKPVGWLLLKKGKYTELKYNDKSSKCQLEYTINYEDIETVDKTDIGQFKTLSYDIECTSIDGTFPNPQRKGDKIIQIGTTINIFGKPEIYKYIATLKKCNPIEGAIVEECKNEKDLILKWCDFVRRVDPDIITGYNIWGFDWKYIYERALSGNGGSTLPYWQDVFKNLARIKNIAYNDKYVTGVKYVEKELKSSALGQNELRYIEIEGIVQVDLLKVIQKDYKLTSYKLNNVSKHFMNNQKEDLSPQELFDNYRKGTPELIKEIATYCIQDCVLCSDLINKLQVIPNNLGMGNVCYIPFSYLFTRGQGIKIFSLVAKRCREEGFIIKDIQKEDIDTSSYEGAIVFAPKPDIYFEPVAVMDYASLYPSSMIAENISHDSLLGFKEYKLINENKNIYEEKPYKDTINNKYNNLPNYNYNNIEYDIFKGIGDDKKKIGKKICRFVEKESGQKSVLPRILVHLLKARKDTRKRMKYKTIHCKNGKKFTGLLSSDDENNTLITIYGDKYVISKSDTVEIETTYNNFQQAVLNGQQLAYKITCNSLYGQVGASTSSICLKELAASTTAIGRQMVIIAKDETINNFKGSKLVYGDSIVGDEPLLLRNKNGKIIIKTIETLSNEWKSYEEFKPFDTNRRNKEQSSTDFEVWSNNKWTKIKRVIRHKTKKDIYRVNTHCGVVDVTEDHSLLNEKCKKIKPGECVIGETKLLHSYPKFDVNINKKNKCLFISKSKLEVAKKYYEYKLSGMHVKIEYNNDNEYKLISESQIYNNRNVIKNIIKLRNSSIEYVYDLETKEGMFQAGIGEIIVKNTDSVFINFVDYIKKKYSDKNKYASYYDEKGNFKNNEMLRLTIETGQIVGKFITKKLKKPQDLEYEKVFYPFIIFSKKRYVGNKYEFSTTKYKQTSMGIVLKRRDNAPIVKKIYGGIIDYILNQKNIHGSKEYYKKCIKDLLHGKVDLESLIISKSLRSGYADPTRIPHKALADRMGERDPGNKPQSNDRVQYCYIDTCNLKCTVCDCKINSSNCKCIKCMKLFCVYHLKNHRNICKNICRFCKKTEKKLKRNIDGWGDVSIKKCLTCRGYYCRVCHEKHMTRKDKYKNEHRDKCKKPLSTKLLQGDIIENPQYIRDNNLKIDYKYYIDHQIIKPVSQIFELVMKNPKNLIQDEMRTHVNKKKGNSMITSFFKKQKK